MFAATGVDSLWSVAVIDLEQIRHRLAGYTPSLRPTDGMGLAGVTVVLRESSDATAKGGGLELLLIERATREGDPWSGHMAFPGGRAEPSDPSLQKTAEREALEEVGIGLANAHYIGRLDDLGGRAAASSKMVVSAYVYHMTDHATIEIDQDEVADAFWVSLDHLVHPDNHVRYPMQYGEHEIVFPGISVGARKDLVVWGLTYRFLEGFFEIIGSPLFDHGIPLPEEFASASDS
jgi:8-oxo-dGTP pyrophosphatase MutT (NUDIX family)